MNNISSAKIYSAQYENAPYRSQATLIEAVEKNDLDQIKQLAMETALHAEVDIDGNTALMIAAKKGLVEAVQCLANNGSDLHAQNQHQETALSLAIATSTCKTALTLFDLGAKISISDLIEKLPSNIKEDPEHTDLLGKLITQADDIDAQNSDGETALFSAVESGNENLVKALLENGADGTLKNKRGKSAFTLAIEYGKFKMVEFFQLRGEPFGIRELINHTMSDIPLPEEKTLLSFIDTSRAHELDEEGRSFLDLAIDRSLLHIAQFLTNIGVKRNKSQTSQEHEKLEHEDIESLFTEPSFLADLFDSVNTTTEAPLHTETTTAGATAMFGIRELIEHTIADDHLLDDSTLLNSIDMSRAHELDEDGRSCLDLAIDRSLFNIAQFLIHLGVKRRTSQISHGHEKLKNALSRYRILDQSLWDDLIDSVDNIHGADSDGFSVLMHATLTQNRYVVEKLIKKGANVNQTNANGQSALLCAVQQENVAIATILLAAGAWVHNKNIEKNPLFAALFYDNIEMIKLLLRYEYNSIELHPNDNFPLSNFKQTCAKSLLYKTKKNLFTKHDQAAARALIALTKLAHVFDLSGQLQCHMRDGKTVLFDPEGSTEKLSNSIVQKYFRMFLETNPNALATAIQHKISGAFSLLNKIEEGVVDDAVDRYLEEEYALIPSGYTEHVINIILTGNYVAVVNRGDAARKPIEVFPIDTEKFQNREFLKEWVHGWTALLSGDRNGFKKHLREELKKPYYLEKDYLSNMVERRFSLGWHNSNTCAFATAEGGLLAMMGLMSLETLHLPIGAPNEDQLSEIGKNLDATREVFNNFRSYMRDMCLQKATPLIERAICRLEVVQDEENYATDLFSWTNFSFVS